MKVSKTRLKQIIKEEVMSANEGLEVLNPEKMQIALAAAIAAGNYSGLKDRLAKTDTENE